MLMPFSYNHLNLLIVLAEEMLDMSSMLLLNEEELKELGFKMGQRKPIMQWIVANSITTSVSSQSSPSTSTMLQGPASFNTTPASNNRQPVQLCGVMSSPASSENTPSSSYRQPEQSFKAVIDPV
jgi:hypothetical protein